MSKLEITLRAEAPNDFWEVEEPAHKAFWDLELPGRTRRGEHLVVQKLRNSIAFAHALNFVALELYPGALSGVSGKLRIDEVFKFNEGEVNDFDKTFLEFDGVGLV